MLIFYAGAIIFSYRIGCCLQDQTVLFKKKIRQYSQPYRSALALGHGDDMRAKRAEKYTPVPNADQLLLAGRHPPLPPRIGQAATSGRRGPSRTAPVHAGTQQL